MVPSLFFCFLVLCPTVARESKWTAFVCTWCLDSVKPQHKGKVHQSKDPAKAPELQWYHWLFCRNWDIPDRVTKEGVPQWVSDRNTHLFHPLHRSCPGGNCEPFQADSCPQPPSSPSVGTSCANILGHGYDLFTESLWFQKDPNAPFPLKTKEILSKTWDLLTLRSVYHPLIQETLKIWQFTLQPNKKDSSRLCWFVQTHFYCKTSCWKVSLQMLMAIWIKNVI